MTDRMTHANEQRHNAAVAKIPSYTAEQCRSDALAKMQTAVTHAANPSSFDMCDDLIYYCTRAVRRINHHGKDGSDSEVAYLLGTADMLIRLLDQTL